MYSIIDQHFCVFTILNVSLVLDLSPTHFAYLKPHVVCTAANRAILVTLWEVILVRCEDSGESCWSQM